MQHVAAVSKAKRLIECWQHLIKPCMRIGVSKKRYKSPNRKHAEQCGEIDVFTQSMHTASQHPK
jgi:hypothetical protein